MGIDLLGPVVDYLNTYFTANGVQAKAVVGERERVKQINSKNGSAGGRVSLVLIGGSYEGPKFWGPRESAGDTTSRSIFQLMAELDVEVWAWDLEDSRNDRKQMSAWALLHEWTLNGLREFARGTVKPTRLVPHPDPTDERKGWSASVMVELPIPIFERPFVQTVDATAQVSSKLVFQKGQDADGEDLPSTEVQTWSGEIPTPPVP